MTDPTVEALKLLVAREGGTKAVAVVIGVNDQSLYQIISGVKTRTGRLKSVGPTIRDKLERHYPGWLHLAGEPSSTGQTITPADAGQSHAMSLANRRMPPPKIGWEALMERDDLPPEFETQLPDNAMAPEAPRGARCMFVTGIEPEPGDWVLLRDGANRLYCRAYVLARPGQWEAHATNPSYLPLQAERDGLRVVAVFDGMRGRKALK